MKINVLRYVDDGDTTLGLMYIDGVFVADTLEDEFREVKVKGETRIPDGTYKVGLRKVLSPLTQKYRDRFGFFKWHLHIQDVKGFNYVYIHCGNSDDHTDGCLLVGSERDLNQMKIWSSRDKFAELYPKIAKAIEDGVEVTITYTDVKSILP